MAQAILLVSGINDRFVPACNSTVFSLEKYALHFSNPDFVVTEPKRCLLQVLVLGVK